MKTNSIIIGLIIFSTIIGCGCFDDLDTDWEYYYYYYVDVYYEGNDTIELYLPIPDDKIILKNLKLIYWRLTILFQKSSSRLIQILISYMLILLFLKNLVI